MTKWQGAQTKAFTVTFPAKSGAQSSPQVIITAGSKESAVAQARHALHEMADQPDSALTVT